MDDSNERHPGMYVTDTRSGFERFLDRTFMVVVIGIAAVLVYAAVTFF